MTNMIRSIKLSQLVPHPDNPNRMSKAKFAKLIRNIERTGRYEPLVVRPCPGRPGCFQIINGYHRYKALSRLDYKAADAVVWDIDDEQTDILLATLNRLGGSDVLERKLALLNRLNKRIKSGELAKLLPQTAGQIERLTNLKMPSRPAELASSRFANPLVFFVSDKQQQIIEKALSLAQEVGTEMAKAAKRAAALDCIARYFINSKEPNQGASHND